jgi:hypothetical protein
MQYQDVRRSPRLRHDSPERFGGWRHGDYAPASASETVPSLRILPPRLSSFGGKGIRTPDFQLAKLALYQLSYAPAGNFECRLPIFDCKGIKQNAGCRSSESTSGTRCFPCLFYCETGTAKYAVNTPVVGSKALPVISPLLFMSLALSR